MAILEKLPAGFLLLYKEWLEAELSQYPVDVKTFRRNDRDKDYYLVKYLNGKRMQLSCNTAHAQETVNNYKKREVIQSRINELERILDRNPFIPTPTLSNTVLNSNDIAFFETLYKNTKQNNESSTNKIIIPHADFYVRSKSEDAACCVYDDFGTEYCYEPHLTELQLIPDFATSIPFLNMFFLHEHFGIIDDPEYRARFLKKLNTYIDAGFIPGKNLLITFETRTNPVNKEYFENKIAAFITNAYFDRVK